ncbi:MAG: dihydroorotase [Cyclobacteriaceae bacterium]
MSLLLKNALILDLQSPYHNKKKDIFIKNGLIESFENHSSKQTIDCEGALVTPGFFDLNASFCDPGLEFREDIQSGSLSASSAGFTDVNLLPDTKPVIQSKSDVEYILARQTKAVDLHISAAISENLEGENLTEMIDLSRAGAESFSEGDGPIWNTKLLLKALQYTSQIGVPVFQNARDPHLSNDTHMHEGLVSTSLGLKGEPSLTEELTIERDLSVLRYSGGEIHFSKISTSEAVNLIRKAKKEGLRVTCDVAIHHLLFVDKSVEGFNSIYKSLPPYRSESDRKALIRGLSDGTIDAISSGHRPLDQESKQLEFDLSDPGNTSMQTFFPSLLKVSGIPLEVLIERITHGPRGVLGIGKTGLIEGSVAKIAILNKSENWILDKQSNLSKSNNSPFWGETLTGKVRATINRDKVTIFK